MTHDEAKARWHEQLESGTSDPELAQHLETCAACRAYAHEMSVVLAALNTARSETDVLPIAEHEPVDAPAVYRPGGMTWRLLRIAAVLALACGAGYWMFVPARSPVRTGPPTIVRRQDTSAPTYGITLHGESASRQFAVANAASTEKVQVYWIYTSLTARTATNAPSKIKRDTSG